MPTETDTLPPAVAVELEGNCAARPAREALLAELDAFEDAVEAALGRRPVRSLTREIAELYALDVAGTWLRSVFWEPSPGWVVWQYGDRGRVEGGRGWVDVNAFAGDEAAFGRFVGG